MPSLLLLHTTCSTSIISMCYISNIWTADSLCGYFTNTDVVSAYITLSAMLAACWLHGLQHKPVSQLYKCIVPNFSLWNVLILKCLQTLLDGRIILLPWLFSKNAHPKCNHYLQPQESQWLFSCQKIIVCLSSHYCECYKYTTISMNYNNLKGPTMPIATSPFPLSLIE